MSNNSMKPTTAQRNPNPHWLLWRDVGMFLTGAGVMCVLWQLFEGKSETVLLLIVSSAFCFFQATRWTEHVTSG